MKIRRRYFFSSAFFSMAALITVLMYHPFWPNMPPEVPAMHPGYTWGISWHPYAQDNQNVSWNALKDLRVGLIRIDARFSDLYPQPGKLDRRKVQELTRFVNDLRARGYQVMVNLGGYPEWSLQQLVKQRDAEGFFAHYRRYVETVATSLGDSIAYYQMGNEINTILDPIPREWDGRICREARQVIDAEKKHWPSWKVKTVINVCDSFYIPWKGELKRLLDEASSSIDVIGYDFYPGNYSYPQDWGAWSLDYISEMMQKYDKDGAICETGCPALFGEKRQARWISESTRAMLNTIQASPVRERYLFAIYYELRDSVGHEFWKPATEASFGILARDGRRKPGFEALKEVITPAQTH